MTSIRNVQVKTFNASGIRSYYNLPCVNECRYEELKDDDKNFPSNEIEEELGACWDPKEGNDTDAKFKPKHQLDYKRVGKGRVDPDDPCTSEAQAHPTAEASAQPYFGFSTVAWVLFYYEFVAAKF
ncbi:uncharacterized protein G2W53_018005 [Senna tora]|uniref:Uncharacterized protein n=1 Tax=Senna tora TaxID=362788 RepID=A0A834TTT3_9FABA|nr:uncharacterized protein G2W53_018005 [Senna tora]